MEDLVAHAFRLEHSPQGERDDLQVQKKRLRFHVFGVVANLERCQIRRDVLDSYRVRILTCGYAELRMLPYYFPVKSLSFLNLTVASLAMSCCSHPR